MRALVTGGAGFIGSTLVDRLLSEGHDVDVVDDLSSGTLANLSDARSQREGRFTFQRLDVRSGAVIEYLQHRKPEVVFHLAAQASVVVSVERPTLDAEVNILGSLNVIQGALAAGTRKVVFAGSGGTLYGIPESIPTREGHPQHPLSPYGVSKKVVIDYLHYYRDVQGLDSTTLALANVYGPRQDPHGEAGVIAIFSAKLLAGERPTIYGDGEQTRDFVFVDDVCDAFVRAAERGGGLTINIGTGSEASVQRLFDTMAREIGFAEPARYAPPRAGELRRSALDPSRAEIHLGWKPWTDLDGGLRRTIDSIRARG
ncbi:MAG TPA: NAD-dependent epimerase/dehydratase family protein [Acidimicrobiia bacterium]|nr:NAD-dependent epimerase/dehydratase family protein [Acidimicrobiia bacterium]